MVGCGPSTRRHSFPLRGTSALPMSLALPNLLYPKFVAIEALKLYWRPLVLTFCITCYNSTKA